MTTEPITLQDILFLFKESERQRKEEALVRQKESEQETLRRKEEALARQEEAKQYKLQREQDRLEEQKRNKALDEKIKQMTKNVGQLGNRLGEFVEEMVRPAAVRLFRERGIEVHEVHRNITSQRNGEGIEIDLLVVNDNDIIAIECKSNLKTDDINAHLKRLDKLKRLLPSYADKRVMGAVSAMVLAPNVVQYAINQGLFVISQTGEHLSICNAEEFEAKSW